MKHLINVFALNLAVTLPDAAALLARSIRLGRQVVGAAGQESELITDNQPRRKT
jgi:hypothetical protein